jgi:hypothetical protein
VSVTVEQDGTSVVVRIPMQIKRRLGRKEVIVRDGLGEAPNADAQEPLVTALAWAFHWETLLDEGRYATIADLARALGVDRRYVGRILNLASLAPDFVESIVRGDEPSGLSLEKLAQSLPMEWKEQRTTLGFKSDCDPSRSLPEEHTHCHPSLNAEL